MEGEVGHRSDKRLSRSSSSDDQVHLFYRAVHHTPFTYYGEIKLVAHSLEKDRPSHFTFRLKTPPRRVSVYPFPSEESALALVAEAPPNLRNRTTRREVWSHNELLLAFNLYCKTPFGRLHKSNPEVVALAALIGRSVNAVAWKLVNFARLDPALQKRGIKGASHGGKGEVEIWNSFHNNWENLALESENLLARLQGRNLEKEAAAESLSESDLGILIPPEGIDRETLVKVRVNQGFFRKTILASYDSTCCVTGLRVPELLVASHIIPWSKAPNRRLDPTNGLCLNALHDRAYDRHVLTVTPDHEVLVSSRIKKEFSNLEEQNFLTRFHGQKITLPRKFRPAGEFLNQHHNEFKRRESFGEN